MNCHGFELIHMREQEPPIDLGRPVLRQRRFWFRNTLYDKPALATVPMEWEPGFHWTTDHVNNFDPDLFMIHLHRVDYEICLARHRLRRNRRWRKRDVELAWAAHNLLADRRSSTAGSTRTAEPMSVPSSSSPSRRRSSVFSEVVVIGAGCQEERVTGGGRRSS